MVPQFFSGQTWINSLISLVFLLLRESWEQARKGGVLNASMFLKFKSPFDPCKRPLSLWRRQYSKLPQSWLNPRLRCLLLLKGSRFAWERGRDFKRRWHLVVTVTNSSLQRRRRVAKGSSCSHLSPLWLNGRKNHRMFILGATSRDFLSRHLPPASTNNMSYAYGVV